ncbi:hypothetical protein Tco_0184409, partial [Tanacetum coccineum]
MEHEQLFVEFNVSAARNLSLSSEVRMRAEYNILEKRKWRSLAEEKDSLLGAKDKEIKELRELLHILRTQNQSLVHKLETSSTDLREKLEMYEESMKCRAIEKGMQEGLTAGIEHEQVGRCLTDLEAYIPSAEGLYNYAISDLCYSPGTGFAIPLMYFELIVRLLILLLYGITLMEVLGSSFLLRSLNLYDPFLNASVTLYGPSHLGPNFPDFSICLLLFASLIAAYSRFSSSSSKLISNASSFSATSTSAVLNVGIPISAGMTAFVL